MTDWVQSIVTIMVTVIASNGFWTWLQSRNRNDTAERKLLVGLAHDRICELGMEYIRRGSITQDEFENLFKYLYKPYKDCGGNGSAERIMEQVRKLPYAQ